MDSDSEISSIKYAATKGNVEKRKDGEGAYYTINTRVYDLTGAIEITVTRADGTTAVGTYSAKAYIYATNDPLTKAMYEFGVAAKAYRNWLLGQ